MSSPARSIAIALLLVASPASAQDDALIMRGVQFLKSGASTQGVGESALAGLALIKARVPKSDPAIAALLRKVESRFDGTMFKPERAGPGGTSVYEAGVISMFLANLDPEAHRSQLEAVAQYLISNQLGRGCWDYSHRKNGDCSISQYGVLGLWEVENAGILVPPHVWENAARFYLSVQDPDGGWRYHPDEGGRATVSMTAAGVGSLLICQRQLDPYRRAAASGNDLLNPLVSGPGDIGNFKVSISNGVIDAAVRKGLAWIAGHYQVGKSPVMGQSVYYGLYGMERIGALAGRQQIGGVDWYERGRSFIVGSQEGDGSWKHDHGDFPNTSWAILFLTKSTEQTVRRIEIKRLGAGTLVGGRGLPKDLSSLTIAGGRVLAQPMNGAIESMLSVLEDPRAEQADSALAGLVTRYRTEGAAVLTPHLERFRKLLRTDPDPGIRGVAAWALGRTGSLDVVPDLIAALEDSDEGVVGQARNGLQLLSRKIEGYGPAPSADPSTRRAAAQRWRAWYDAVKPPDYSRDQGAP